MKKALLISLAGFFLSAPAAHAASFQQEEEQLLQRQRSIQLEMKRVHRLSTRAQDLKKEMAQVRDALISLRQQRSGEVSDRKERVLSSRRRLTPVALPTVPEPPKSLVNTFESGKASYYADMFNGRKTASGQVFSNSEMTAAHKTLPFGTRVRVRNISNGNTVEVTITDRGPFTPGRIIDLTSHAFSQLDRLSRGIIDVEIEVIN